MKYYKHRMGNCYATEEELLQWYSVEFPHCKPATLKKIITDESGFARVSKNEYEEMKNDSVSLTEYFLERE